MLMRMADVDWTALPLADAPGLIPYSDHDRISILAGLLSLKRMVSAPRILVFDSGLGGLTVYREVARARPDARFVYVADDAFFPYGAHGEAELVARVVEL